jgi:hypothetical protein
MPPIESPHTCALSISSPRSSPAASAASSGIEVGRRGALERPEPRLSNVMHSKRVPYRSSTGSNTADEIVKPVSRSSGSPVPWRS